ncbi:MAG: zinc ribbon domain-containing protein [Nitrososphaeria archaeon]|nr:zinc ribbon domain-containing protein [Nitrososphaeria archaeon]
MSLIILNSPTFALYNIISPQATITLPTTIFPTVTFTFLPTYSLSVTPSNVTIDQGEQLPVTVTVGSYFGYNKTISLYSSNVPPGFTINFALNKLTPPVNGNISTTAFISVSKTVVAGKYKMFINATDGSIKRGVEINVKVVQITTTPPTTTPTTSPTSTSPTTTSTTPTTTSPTTTSPTPTTTPTTTSPTTSTTTPSTPSPTTSPTTVTTSQPTTTTSAVSSGGIDTTTIVIIAIILIAVFAAIAFFLLRKKPPPPPPPAKRYCMHCGSGMPDDAVSCPKCGKQPAGGPDTKVCPNCGSVINIVASFCPKCGAAQPKVGEKGGSTSS